MAMATDGVPDYYEEFGIDRSATADQVSGQLDRAFRTWSSRASRAPDAKKRREAEDKVELISQAREELLDRARRGAYDCRLDQARQRLSSAEPPPPPQTQSAQSGRDWVGHARRLINQGDEEGALYELRQAVHHDDANGDAWRLLGAVHVDRGRLDDALQEFQRALALLPGDALTHTLVAQLHERRGDRSTAADWHLAAARLAPDDAAARVDAARNLFMARRYDEALSNYEQVLAKQPGHQAVRDQIGRIWALRAKGAMAWHPARQRYVVASAKSAPSITHCVDQALAVGISDTELLRQLTGFRADASKALTWTWRWHRNMVPVMGLCFMLMLVHQEALDLLALAGFFGLPIVMGVKPRWRHNRNSLPPNQRP